MLRILASEQTEQDALKLDLDALVREGARRTRSAFSARSVPCPNTSATATHQSQLSAANLTTPVVLKNRHAGEKPPASFKAVWYRGRYGEWDRNSYAERARASRNGTTSPNGSKPQPPRLPYTDRER